MSSAAIINLQPGGKMTAANAHLNDSHLSHERMAFKSKGVIKFVPVHEIQWVEAEGNYVRLMVRGESHLIRETMSNMASKLAAAPFIRIHRSRLVNLRYVKEIQAWSGNQQSTVIMQDGSEFPLSRGCRRNVRHLLK